MNEAAVAEVTERALTYPERAKELRITNDDTYRVAGEFLLGVKALRQEIGDTLNDTIAAANLAHKTACAAKNKAEAPLIEAEGIIKREVSRYETEQERLRRDLEAKLAAEARKFEEEARLAEAEQLEAAGEPELAERVLEAPSVAPPVVVPRQIAKVAGITTRELWQGEVTDLQMLVRAVAVGRAPIELLQVNESALNGLARSLKGGFNVPGCRAFAERVVAASRR